MRVSQQLWPRMLHYPDSTFTYRNDTDKSVAVYVEPWAHDFTVLPGQLLKICAQSAGHGLPQFELHHATDSLQLWCESTDDFAAFVDDKAVTCGHNRNVDGA